ncbi:hypothetical protein WMY93_027086 [Mugilogobius chulae]|uniref:P2X purinoreceptor 7 intracellular domain-containing protein n=1 Tax=Mugilogobius chulae TaxID=88201 RepID=A0AAW0MWM1_9GOBI
MYCTIKTSPVGDCDNNCNNVYFKSYGTIKTSPVEESSDDEFVPPVASKGKKAPKRRRASASKGQKHGDSARRQTTVPVGESDEEPVASTSKPPPKRARSASKGPGERAVPITDLTNEDRVRVEEIRNERRRFERKRIQALDLTQAQEVLTQVLDRDPSVIFDVFNYSAPPELPSPNEGLKWCRCTRCREMPTDLEKKCCNQSPESCFSITPHFEVYIIDRGVLRLARRLWNDFRAVYDEPDLGEDYRQFRHAAYRQYVAWKHGVLGAGRRVVIPSCVVWKIRDTFPDPTRTYTGFIPSRL